MACYVKKKPSYKKYEELRNKRGVTNYRVSMDTGVPQINLSDWKLGKSSGNNVNMLYAIAEYFGVTVEDLMA